jgi:hypothetical protein
MESTEQLLKRFQKRDLVADGDPAPEPRVSSREGQFVRVRRKDLAGDATDLEQGSQEALIDEEEGVIALGG